MLLNVYSGASSLSEGFGHRYSSRKGDYFAVYCLLLTVVSLFKLILGAFLSVLFERMLYDLTWYTCLI